ncbi:MAG: S58 family peptidase [Alphaproteobacteria bacterium]|nr:S58 family peptidase [Alphaproteobacteria bacterium]
MRRAFFIAAALALLVSPLAASPAQPRARDLGVPFDGTPGPLNAITDVAGVTVGQVTIIKDYKNGHKARTGVTAILPRGKGTLQDPVFAGVFAMNGNGEMTGVQWIEESGMLEGPVMITNTHSVGVVRDGVIKWRVKQGVPDASGYWWSLPVVAETWDGYLNDINGFHVTEEDAGRALEAAKPGPVAEGNVGGGTGMKCHEFKCGIGAASRVVRTPDGKFTVGVLVQANYGVRDTLTIAGVPVGKYLRNDLIYPRDEAKDEGSIIIVVATDAPLIPPQLKAMAKRAAMGLARDGGYSGDGSGDLFIAFSTANKGAEQDGNAQEVKMLTNARLDPLFLATIEATEEAIINAMIAAKDMTGEDGHVVKAVDHKALQDVLRKFNRLDETP